MRYINAEGLGARVPNGWLDRAQQALNAVRNAAPGERPAIIQGNAALWRELKDVLASVSHDKCWYCESKEIRSDYVIDHFRPKSRVAESPEHSGYWWLAFDVTNFRFCCTYCNSRRTDREGGAVGGKHDHFPLVDEGDRCFSEDRDILRERPLLLDPTNEVDPTLLWFEPDGRVVPRYDAEVSEIFNSRAEVSIQLFHLNEVKVTSRRHELHSQLARTITDAQKQFRAAAQDCEVAQQALEAAFRTIRNSISSTSTHSSAARAMLLAFAGDHPWLETILATQE